MSEELFQKLALVDLIQMQQISILSDISLKDVKLLYQMATLHPILTSLTGSQLLMIKLTAELLL